MPIHSFGNTDAAADIDTNEQPNPGRELYTIKCLLNTGPWIERIVEVYT